ncbi:hypothetical protein [Halobellus rarus]|uniref:DUF8073 domain-containing protein n=1 Tax=Halobellus rarus TaxID=1126237 RepID=A0ABD6CKC8_9EURY|nr:hypothetical protein [Halobellus rarus]
MDTRHAVLVLVLVLTAVMTIRGIVAAASGDIGTVGRQVVVGALLLVFGIGLYRRWTHLG